MLTVPEKVRVPTSRVFEQLDPCSLVKSAARNSTWVRSADSPLVSSGQGYCLG